MLDKLLWLPLLLHKKKIGPIPLKNEKKLFQIIKKLQMSSFVLNFIQFNDSNLLLRDSLNKLSMNYVKKYILMKKDLKKITFIFDNHNIEYVLMKGFALKLAGYYPENSRIFRDIDILVAEKDLKCAYSILKENGYSYFNEDSRDGIKYLWDMHHIPPMTNKNNTILELHHRVTKKKIFHTCPLASKMLKNKRIKDDIFIPSSEDLIAHSLYHGTAHHNFLLGPVFILDIQRIYKNDLDFKYLEETINSLQLTDLFKKIIRLIDECNKSIINEDNILEKIHDELGDYGMDFKHNERSLYLFRKPKGKVSKRITVSNVITWLKFNSFNYQEKIFSLRFIKIIIKNIYQKKFLDF